MAHTFDNPLRKLIHKPKKIFKEFVQEGMTVADIGCGFGCFSIGLAKMVGKKEKFILSICIKECWID